LSESAMLRALDSLKTPLSKSMALLVCVTRWDQRREGRAAERPAFLVPFPLRRELAGNLSTPLRLGSALPAGGCPLGLPRESTA
jgi:hypothetical protein